MRIDDRVRLRCVPAPVIADRKRFPETCELFEKSVGHSFTIRGKNAAGMAEIWVNEDGTDAADACADSLFVEAEYLETR